MEAYAECSALGAFRPAPGHCAHGLVCSVQLADLKSKLVWKGSGKQVVKGAIAPGEPDLDAKQPAIPMHGGVC